MRVSDLVRARREASSTHDHSREWLPNDKSNVRVHVLPVDSLSSSEKNLEGRWVLLGHLGDEEVHVLCGTKGLGSASKTKSLRDEITHR